MPSTQRDFWPHETELTLNERETTYAHWPHVTPNPKYCEYRVMPGTWTFTHKDSSGSLHFDHRSDVYVEMQDKLVAVAYTQSLARSVFKSRFKKVAKFHLAPLVSISTAADFDGNVKYFRDVVNRFRNIESVVKPYKHPRRSNRIARR